MCRCRIRPAGGLRGVNGGPRELEKILWGSILLQNPSIEQTSPHELIYFIMDPLKLWPRCNLVKVGLQCEVLEYCRLTGTVVRLRGNTPDEQVALMAVTNWSHHDWTEVVSPYHQLPKINKWIRPCSKIFLTPTIRVKKYLSRQRGYTATKLLKLLHLNPWVRCPSPHLKWDTSPHLKWDTSPHLKCDTLAPHFNNSLLHFIHLFV